MPDAQTSDACCEMLHCRFGHSSTWQVMFPHMQQPVEECTRGYHHAFGMQFHSPDGSDTHHLVLPGDQFAYLVLPDVE